MNNPDMNDAHFAGGHPALTASQRFIVHRLPEYRAQTQKNEFNRTLELNPPGRGSLSSYIIPTDMEFSPYGWRSEEEARLMTFLQQLEVMRLDVNTRSGAAKVEMFAKLFFHYGILPQDKITTNFRWNEVFNWVEQFQYEERDKIIMYTGMRDELGPVVLAHARALARQLQHIRNTELTSGDVGGLLVKCWWRPLAWERHRGRGGGSAHTTASAADIVVLNKKRQVNQSRTKLLGDALIPRPTGEQLRQCKLSGLCTRPWIGGAAVSKDTSKAGTRIRFIHLDILGLRRWTY